ncbi:hypothetical protein AJ80_09907 [Polytolypa hystricis UAMH7299]|uniref:Uncharacterized protein n=1 Tax=Polytolypa hystricis (strain UAMH7299) TaxID=1447883 RepID=A0A2B7WGF9_POLH7|nr:hypothetical protein AJ80_09907 [Polytolypa hystricis UAMH7299]
MPPLKDTAVKAASKLRSKDKANLEYTSLQTGKQFKSDPWKNVVESYAIVWTDMKGRIPPPYPGRHLVIMGLDYMDENNGLPNLPDKEYLDHGEYVVISGDDEMILSDKGGGGLSLFIVLDMS